MPPEDKDNFSNDWDFVLTSEKANRRMDIVARSIARFIAGFNKYSRERKSNTNYVFDHTTRQQCAERAARVVFEYESWLVTMRTMVVHDKNDGRIDRHKIIAGKQAAIMTALPLRIQKYTHITGEQVDAWYRDQRGLLTPKSLPDSAAPFVQTILHNAQFAFSLGIDILCVWNGIEQKSRSFIKSNSSLCECYPRLLLNTFQNRDDDASYDSVLFWCSHFWYALEKDLLYWSRYGTLSQ